MLEVPTRISTADADYDPYVGCRLQVHLDGVRQIHVSGYDIDAGTVTRAKRNEEGALYCVGDEIAAETVTGKVEVTILPA